jgi:hypothetical protein
MSYYSKLSGTDAIHILTGDEYNYIINMKDKFILILRALQRKTFIQDITSMYYQPLGKSKYPFLDDTTLMKYIKSNLDNVIQYISQIQRLNQTKLIYFKKNMPLDVMSIIKSKMKSENFYTRLLLFKDIIQNLFKIHKQYYKIHAQIQSYNQEPGAGYMELIMELQEQLQEYKMNTQHSSLHPPPKTLSKSTKFSTISTTKMNIQTPSISNKYVDITQKYVTKNPDGTYSLPPNYKFDGTEEEKQMILKIIKEGTGYLPNSPKMMKVST